MSSKRSTSKRLERAARAIRAIAFLPALAALFFPLTLIGGCANDAKPVADTPKRGYVRLAALVAAHPMQREAERLQEMERRLREMTPLIAPPGPSLDLPPLSNAATSAGLTAEGRERREKERARLRSQIEAQLAEFAAGRAARNARLLEQQRAELLGLLTAQDRDKANNARNAIEAQIIAQLEALVKRKLEIYGRLAVLAGQLNNVMDYVAPPPSGVKLDEGKAAAGPAGKSADKPPRTMNDFLTAQQERERAKLRSVDAEINAVKQQGRLQLSEADAEALARRIAEIDARLDALRDDFNYSATGLEQRRALEAALAAENKAWQASLQSAGNGGGIGTIRLTALHPSPVSLSLSTAEAAETIARQRAELERFIMLTVTDAVRDIARVRGVDVQILTDTGAANTGQTKIEQGKPDMTSQFGQWITSAASISPPAPTANGGNL